MPWPMPEALPAALPPLAGGWWPGARPVASPNHGPRPDGTAVTLLVLHSISLPPGVYGGDEIERLFTNTLDWNAHPYFEQIRGAEVSAHFVIRRDGEVLQFVSCDRRAWHAGQSAWCGRANCNDFSIGIELEGLEGTAFEPAQYAALGPLVAALATAYPLADVAGHEHVAPGRKHDPGAAFDWALAEETACRQGVKLHWPPRISLEMQQPHG